MVVDNPRDIQWALQASIVLHVVLFLSIIGWTYAGGQEKSRVLMEVEVVSPVTMTPTLVERPHEPKRVVVARSPVMPPVFPVKKKVALPAPQPKQRNRTAKHPESALPIVNKAEVPLNPNDAPSAPQGNPEPPAPPSHSTPPAANLSGGGGSASKPAMIASPFGMPSGNTGGSGDGGSGIGVGGGGESQVGSGAGSAGARVSGVPAGGVGGGQGGGAGTSGHSEVVKETPKPPPPPKTETPVPPPLPMALKREEVKREEAPRIETKREEPPRPEPPREEPLTQAKPKYRNNPKPDYPPDARRQKQEGVVYLLVSINARGRVEDVQVDQSSGFTLLDEAALKAVRRWEFEPARRGDTPVPTRVRVPIRFKLE